MDGTNKYVGSWNQNPALNACQTAALEARTAGVPDRPMYQRPYALAPGQPDVNRLGKFQELFESCLYHNQIGSSNAEGIRDCAHAAQWGPACWTLLVWSSLRMPLLVSSFPSKCRGQWYDRKHLLTNGRLLVAKDVHPNCRCHGKELARQYRLDSNDKWVKSTLFNHPILADPVSVRDVALHDLDEERFGMSVAFHNSETWRENVTFFVWRYDRKEPQSEKQFTCRDFDSIAVVWRGGFSGHKAFALQMNGEIRDKSLTFFVDGELGYQWQFDLWKDLWTDILKGRRIRKRHRNVPIGPLGVVRWNWLSDETAAPHDHGENHWEDEQEPDDDWDEEWGSYKCYRCSRFQVWQAAVRIEDLEAKYLSVLMDDTLFVGGKDGFRILEEVAQDCFVGWADPQHEREIDPLKQTRCATRYVERLSFVRPVQDVYFFRKSTTYLYATLLAAPNDSYGGTLTLWDRQHRPAAEILVAGPLSDVQEPVVELSETEFAVAGHRERRIVYRVGVPTLVDCCVALLGRTVAANRSTLVQTKRALQTEVLPDELYRPCHTSIVAHLCAVTQEELDQ